jgi:hypothetical protein
VNARQRIHVLVVPSRTTGSQRKARPEGREQPKDNQQR